MIRFEAEKYLEIIRILTKADFDFKAIENLANKPLSPENRELFLNVVIRGVRNRAEEIRLITLVEYINLAEGAIKMENSTGGDLEYYCRGICDVLISEVKAHLFIQIDPGKRELYLNPNTGIGTLAIAYPDVSGDLFEANLCYSFERYTACVHHLMVAVEVALRRWARQT